jgi:hypothetical protein
MKSFRLIFATVVFFQMFSVAQAQVTARRLTHRIAPQAHTNTARATTPQGPTAAPAAAPAPVPAPAPALTVRTQALVRLVPPPVDPEKARAAKDEAQRKTVEFQKKRAAEGSESAQYELGMRYLKGDGVEKDEATGRKWLTESAKNGYTAASKKLEDLDHPAAAPETTKTPGK